MAQIAANPWTFTNADQATSAAITSITNQVNSILVTTTAAHGLVAPNPVSLQGTTYNGPYRILAVPSTTTLLLQNRDQYRGLANGGAAGNVLSMAYLFAIRSEQVYWQASAVSQVLLLTDGFGNTLWNPTAQNTAGITPYSYGKLFWTQNGLVINTLPATGYVQMTIN